MAEYEIEIIPVKTENIKDLERLKEKYPISVYGGEEVIWVPNPEAYNFTRHYEELDANMQHIPWTGYNYWLRQIYRDDSQVRRYIVGLPDSAEIGRASCRERV